MGEERRKERKYGRKRELIKEFGSFGHKGVIFFGRVLLKVTNPISDKP